MISGIFIQYIKHSVSESFPIGISIGIVLDTFDRPVSVFYDPAVYLSSMFIRDDKRIYYFSLPSGHRIRKG